jgi:sensor histidine kinase regulating citrate/malate metabolism
MEQPVEQKRKGFLDRPVRLRWPVRIVLGLIVIGLICYGIHLWQLSSLRGQAREALQNEIRQKGEALAQTIAVTAREDIRSSNSSKLQEYFADLVKQPDLQYLIVMETNGKAVVHTDAKFRGKKLDDDLARKALSASETQVTNVESRSLYDIAVPVMGFTSKAAVVRVGISYARARQALGQ